MAEVYPNNYVDGELRKRDASYAKLMEYARHKPDCQRYGAQQCTCGFAEFYKQSLASPSPESKPGDPK